MTNEELFRAIFGLDVDTNTIPIHCNEECPYFTDGCEENCHAEDWWQEKIKKLDEDILDTYVEQAIYDAYIESRE